jgi:dTDP-4-dehydrorhamnose reductase
VRVWVSGGSGFVGSNVVKVFTEQHGAEVVAPAHGDVDLTESEAVRASVAEHRPDAIVHTAILNDLPAMLADRRAAWVAYVGATRHLVDAANDVGAKLVLVSTDWVFDGSQGGADETAPPNPINLYGVLKLASELVVTERARQRGECPGRAHRSPHGQVRVTGRPSRTDCHAARPMASGARPSAPVIGDGPPART